VGPPRSYLRGCLWRSGADRLQAPGFALRPPPLRPRTRSSNRGRSRSCGVARSDHRRPSDSVIAQRGAARSRAVPPHRGQVHSKVRPAPRSVPLGFLDPCGASIPLAVTMQAPHWPESSFTRRASTPSRAHLPRTSDGSGAEPSSCPPGRPRGCTNAPAQLRAAAHGRQSQVRDDARDPGRLLDRGDDLQSITARAAAHTGVERTLGQPCPDRPQRAAVLVRRRAVPLPRLGDARRFALGASTPWGRVPVQPRAWGPRRHASQGFLRRQDAAGRAVGIRAGLNDFTPAPDKGLERPMTDSGKHAEQLDRPVRRVLRPRDRRQGDTPPERERQACLRRDHRPSAPSPASSMAQAPGSGTGVVLHSIT